MQGKQYNRINGFAGEAESVAFLKKKKYKILITNFTCKLGEIDIIALDGKTLVFIEVKSRSTFAYGRPIEAVDERKIYKIKRVAEFYLMLHRQLERSVRFDVIEICGEEITHHINAFM